MKGPCDEHPITNWGTDTEAALATVREALRHFKHHWTGERDPDAALDILASELHAWKMLDEERVAEIAKLHISIEGAMARVVELEGELADAETCRDQWIIMTGDKQARLDRAVGALREIATHNLIDQGDRFADAATIAEATLAEIEESAC